MPPSNRRAVSHRVEKEATKQSEVQRLVREFESSGLGQSEFCRKEGLALSTLRRQLKRDGRIKLN